MLTQGQEDNTQGKSLTLERLYSQPSLSGRLTQGIEWRPDSKSFSYLERRGTGKDAVTELWTMDTATGERKVLIDATTLKGVTQPEKEKTTQATGLGRVQADNYQWAPGGDSLLFIGSNSLVLLDLKTMAPKSLVSSSNEIEDPKFSPELRARFQPLGGGTTNAFCGRASAAASAISIFTIFPASS